MSRDNEKFIINSGSNKLKNSIAANETLHSTLDLHHFSFTGNIPFNDKSTTQIQKI